MREFVLWSALLLPIYSYVGFPLLIIGGATLIARLRKPPFIGEPVMPQPLLPVAVVVAAYNEEACIGELVSNLRAQNYPGPVRIYLGSDGSTDGTADVMRAHADHSVSIAVFPANRGKASVLNDLVARVVEPIICFTDANSRLLPDALSRLVPHFADARIGAVCGELELRASVGGDNVDSLYWRLERVLKASEGMFGALLGANGGIYAIRRELYVPLRPDTLIDDFCIAMTVAASGKRLVYEAQARAVEYVPVNISDEFTRRVRIGIGNYQALFRHPEYLFRTNASTAFAYVSHKVLRWFTPHLLLVALCVNTLLLDEPFYRILWFVQLAVYAICIILYLLSARLQIPRILKIPVFLVAMNLAFGLGFLRYVAGRHSGSWKRTARA